MSDSGRVAAKRGDLCIVHEHHNYSYKGDKPGEWHTSESDSYIVGRVTNIFREGRVKGYQTAHIGSEGEPATVPWTQWGGLARGTERVWVISKDKIDVARAMHLAAHNTYRIINQHLNTSSTHTRYFDSLGVLRAALGIPQVDGKVPLDVARPSFAVGQVVRLAGDDLTDEEANKAYRIMTVCGIVPDCYEIDLGVLGGTPYAMHCDAHGLLPATTID